MATPSAAEGVPAAMEARHRFFACELVQEAGILLSLPQVVLATGQSLLHRFYAGQSLTDFDAFRVAMGCIFLAAKAEEQPRRVKDVIQVFFRMRNRRMGLQPILLMPSDQRFSQWSDYIIMVERQLLIEVGFSIDAMTEHPHKFLLYYVKILDGSNALAQKAWNYVNDSFRLDLCLRFDAHVIACAAISLAARVLGVPLPLKWDVLLEVDTADVDVVAREMLAVYTYPRVRWIEPLTVVNPYEVIRGEVPATDESKLDAMETPPPSTVPDTDTPTKSEHVDDVPTTTEAPAVDKEARGETSSRGRSLSSSRDTSRAPREASRSRDRRRESSRSRERRREPSRSRDRRRQRSRDRHPRRRSRSRSRSRSSRRRYR